MNGDTSIIGLRSDYALQGLGEADLDPNPFAQFGRWLNDALAAGLPEPNAMTLATATPEAIPAARIVLLRGMDERGFVFFTNYESRKGAELGTNPNAALVFFWVALQRQVRVEGTVELISESESDNYFNSRPRGSQLGAWASPQSQILSGRDRLEQRVQELELQFEGRDVPRPPFWGGFRVRPSLIEFWQGRTSRLHDRLRYRRDNDQWLIERLAP